MTRPEGVVASFMAKLILLSGPEPTEFELAPINTLGRHPDNTIQILDRIISKEHAEIYKGPNEQFFLRDLGSLNGTYVGANRVEKDHVLHDGDEILLGSTKLLYREQTSVQGALNKVTIAPGMFQSHIRQRISADKEIEFKPEREISDEKSLREDYERLRIAHELSKSVGSEFDLDRLMAKILDKAFELLPADRGVILLFDDAGQLVPRVVKQKSGTADQIVLSNSILNQVMREKEAVLSSDAMVDSRFSGAHSIIIQGIRSTMCVPLLHGSELLGIMHLDSQIATNAFNEKDLLIFTGIGTQAAVAIQNARLAAKNEWEARTRAQFQRFFSPGLVQQMVEGKLKLEGVGETREVSVLFADIRGFTAMTENSNAHDIVNMLNDYFEVMVEVLFRFDGTLDKYVGDEIMALFGVPVSQSDAAVRAVTCALEMQHALKEFNRTRNSENQPPISIGIGINTGQCIYGAIGSSKTVQYTVIGDAVNTASRLCSSAQGNEILCSEATYQQASSVINASALPPLRVKGKVGELKVYRVNSLR